jgi:hypothetical protein
MPAATPVRAQQPDEAAPQHLLAVWLVWLIGPSTFAASCVLGQARIDVLVLSNVGGCLALVAMLLTRGHRSSLEFWLLSIYFVAAGAWVGSIVAEQAILALPTMLAMLSVFVAIPVLGVSRLVRQRVARPTSSSAASV